MPIAGSIAAASAANRQARARRSNAVGSTTRAQKTLLANPLLGERAPAATNPGGVSGKVSSEGTSGMFTALKRQVDAVKKQQHAFAQKVSKGFAMTGLTSGVKKAISGDGSGSNHEEMWFERAAETAKSSTAKDAAKLDDGLNPAWIAALEEMGFEASEIREAAAKNGAKPLEFDDLLQVVLAMHDSKADASAGSAADRALRLAAAEKREATSRQQRSTMDDYRRERRPQPTAEPANAELALSAPAVPTASTVTVPLAAQCTSSVVIPPSSCAAAETVVGPAAPAASQPTPPPFPAMSACGSAEFESAANRFRPPRLAVPAPTLPPRGFSSSSIAHLRSMGFSPEDIQQACAILGPNSSIDDLFDVLIAIRAPISPQRSSTASSSTDLPAGATRLPVGVAASASKTVDMNEPSPQDVAQAIARIAACEAASAGTPAEIEHLPHDPEQPTIKATLSADFAEEKYGQQEANDSRSDAADDVYDVAVDSPSSDGHPIERAIALHLHEANADEVDDIEVPTHVLAAAVVASVITKASENDTMLPQQEFATEPKHAIDERIAASPCRGGA